MHILNLYNMLLTIKAVLQLPFFIAENLSPQLNGTAPSDSAEASDTPSAGDILAIHPTVVAFDNLYCGAKSSCLPCPAEKPALHQLLCLQGEGGKRVRVMETVAAHWENLAVALGFESCVIETIQRDTHYQTVSACRQILQRWLEEKGPHPVNWHTLTEALVKAGYPKLAADVRGLLNSN